MKSFKLDTKSSIKKQLSQGGIFAVAVSLPMLFIFAPLGAILALLGAFMLLASMADND